MAISPRTRRLLGRAALVAAISMAALALAGVTMWRRLTALPTWFEEEDEAGLATTPADDDWVAADPTGRVSEGPRDQTAEALLEHLDPPGAGKSGVDGGFDGVEGQGEAITTPLGRGGVGSSRERASSVGRGPRTATMRNFHLRSAIRNESLRRAAKASRAEFIDGQLRAGVVIEPALVERDTLDPATQRTLERALRLFPGARSRRVYLGLVDTPRTVDGLLPLGPDTRLRVGDVELEFDTAMRRLGLSPARVRGQLDAELRRLKVRDPRLAKPATDQ